VPSIQLPPLAVHRLISKQVGDSFEIRVLLPPLISGETTRFPVVYMTDVHAGFPVDADMLRMLMMYDVPRFIAVGIGYPAAGSIMQGLAIRARDLTQVEVKAEQAGGDLPFAGMVKPAVRTGGAPKFLGFIRDELMPFIDARYPTNPNDRAYWGDSLGGLFGCYVLFTRPDTFNRYIIGSPSIWWGGEEMIKRAEGFLASASDLRASVFMGVGGLEELGPGASFRMVTNLLRLETMLRAKKYPGLQLTTRIFPDESHTTVVGMNLVRGLVSVFGPAGPEDGLMAKYAAMTRKSTSQ
jgi:predicted alpha/beta superfamily hydrolase